ncbi:MAG: hypothetical protein PGN23_11605 [Sphingomonas adhaesiva]|uniref:hypothetical protein n=1 Tax=Sphingomonas adhaesiva TaxID=28212 RepID=UPI002FF8E8C4
MAVVLPGTAHADALQSDLLATMQATRADGFAFQRRITVDRTGAARKVIVDRYDPRRPEAQRWSIVSIDGRPPTAKEQSKSLKDRRGQVSSYAELAKWFGAPATRIDAAPGQVLYRFPRLPDDVVKVGPHDASPDTQAEATVNTSGKIPFVERVRFVTAKPFRMMLVASVQGMTVTARYRQLPSGQVVPATIASSITGSMLGKSGRIDTLVAIEDIQPVR